MEKEVMRTDKNGEKITKNISYIVQFIDSARFMASSLSNLVNNFFEKIHRIKCKYRHDDKKCETCRIKYKYCDCFLEYINFKDDLTEYKCLCCNKNYQIKSDKKLKEGLFNIYKFSNHSYNKFILLLRKVVYSYEYMDDWEKFSETFLPEKEDFYSQVNMEDITDADYAHAKQVCKDFEIKNLGEYYDLYVQSHTLLLADVFKNFRSTCLKIYELDPAKFLSVPGLDWQAALKKTKVKLDLLTDMDMLLMVEKAIRGVICHSIYLYAKADNKYMKYYNKNKELSYHQYWDVNNLYGWAMLQKLPVNNFEWMKDTSQFNEDFIKNYNEEIDKGYLFEVDIQYLEKLHELRYDLPFLPERMKI